MPSEKCEFCNEKLGRRFLSSNFAKLLSQLPTEGRGDLADYAEQLDDARDHVCRKLGEVVRFCSSCRWRLPYRRWSQRPRYCGACGTELEPTAESVPHEHRVGGEGDSHCVDCGASIRREPSAHIVVPGAKRSVGIWWLPLPESPSPELRLPVIIPDEDPLWNSNREQAQQSFTLRFFHDPQRPIDYAVVPEEDPEESFFRTGCTLSFRLSPAVQSNLLLQEGAILLFCQYPEQSLICGFTRGLHLELMYHHSDLPGSVVALASEAASPRIASVKPILIDASGDIDVRLQVDIAAVFAERIVSDKPAVDHLRADLATQLAPTLQVGEAAALPMQFEQWNGRIARYQRTIHIPRSQPPGSLVTRYVDLLGKERTYDVQFAVRPPEARRITLEAWNGQAWSPVPTDRELRLIGDVDSLRLRLTNLALRPADLEGLGVRAQIAGEIVLATMEKTESAVEVVVKLDKTLLGSRKRICAWTSYQLSLSFSHPQLSGPRLPPSFKVALVHAPLPFVVESEATPLPQDCDRQPGLALGATAPPLRVRAASGLSLEAATGTLTEPAARSGRASPITVELDGKVRLPPKLPSVSAFSFKLQTDAVPRQFTLRVLVVAADVFGHKIVKIDGLYGKIDSYVTFRALHDPRGMRLPSAVVDQPFNLDGIKLELSDVDFADGAEGIPARDLMLISPAERRDEAQVEVLSENGFSFEQGGNALRFVQSGGDRAIKVRITPHHASRDRNATRIQLPIAFYPNQVAYCDLMFERIHDLEHVQHVVVDVGTSCSAVLFKSYSHDSSNALYPSPEKAEVEQPLITSTVRIDPAGDAERGEQDDRYTAGPGIENMLLQEGAFLQRNVKTYFGAKRQFNRQINHRVWVRHADRAFREIIVRLNELTRGQFRTDFRSVVVTYPLSWSIERVEKMAHFIQDTWNPRDGVLTELDEATAASLWYVHSSGRFDGDSGGALRLMNLDIGAGTTDVAEFQIERDESGWLRIDCVGFNGVPVAGNEFSVRVARLFASKMEAEIKKSPTARELLRGHLNDVQVFPDPKMFGRTRITSFAQENEELISSLGERLKVLLIERAGDAAQPNPGFNFRSGTVGGVELDMVVGGEHLSFRDVLSRLLLFKKDGRFPLDRDELTRIFDELDFQISLDDVKQTLWPLLEEICVKAYVAPLGRLDTRDADERPDVDVVVLSGQSSLLPWWNDALVTFFEREGNRRPEVVTVGSAWERKLAVTRGAQMFYESKLDSSRRHRYRMVGRLLERTRLPVGTSDWQVLIERMRPFWEMRPYPHARKELSASGRLQVRLFTKTSIDEREPKSAGPVHLVAVSDDVDDAGWGAPPEDGTGAVSEQQMEYLVWVDTDHELRGALYRGFSIAEQNLPPVVRSLARLRDTCERIASEHLQPLRQGASNAQYFPLAPFQDLPELVSCSWRRRHGRIVVGIFLQVGDGARELVRVIDDAEVGRVQAGSLDLVDEFTRLAGQSKNGSRLLARYDGDDHEWFVLPGAVIGSDMLPIVYTRAMDNDNKSLWTRWEVQNPEKEEFKVFSAYADSVGALGMK